MKIAHILCLAGLLIFAISCKDKQASTPVVSEVKSDQTNDEKTSMVDPKNNILCFGNSLTAGYGLEEEEAWPFLLQERLDSLGKDYKVINAGLSGETTSGGLNRIDWILKQPVDIFILELGANDLLRGLVVDKTLENLDGIIQRVLAKYPEAKIILAGMLAPPNMGSEYESQFNKIFPQLAMKYKTALIPFFLEDVAGEADLNLPDGKHPNKKGQKIVLENVWASLDPLL